MHAHTHTQRQNRHPGLGGDTHTLLCVHLAHLATGRTLITGQTHIVPAPVTWRQDGQEGSALGARNPGPRVSRGASPGWEGRSGSGYGWPLPAQGLSKTPPEATPGSSLHGPQPCIPVTQFLLPCNHRPSSFGLSRGSDRRPLSGCGAGVQNHVFIFIRNVLGIKTIMRYTLSSITITRHPGTELRVIGRRGRRAGGQDTRQTGRGQAGRLRATGTHTEATRRTRHLATHSRFVFVLAFLCFDFFFPFFLFSDM